jgi:dihydroorotate dehydrogenase
MRFFYEGDTVVGQEVKVEIKMSKQCPPKTSDETNHLKLFYVSGKKEQVMTTFDDAIRLGIIESKGAMLNYGDVKIRGKKAFIAKLDEDEELLKTLVEKVKNTANKPLLVKVGDEIID